MCKFKYTPPTYRVREKEKGSKTEEEMDRSTPMKIDKGVGKPLGKTSFYSTLGTLLFPFILSFCTYATHRGKRKYFTPLQGIGKFLFPAFPTQSALSHIHKRPIGFKQFVLGI